MKTGTLVLIMTLFSINSFAATEPFVFGQTQTDFSIGNYQVRSCDIVIPNLGASETSIIKVLTQKGYDVIVDDNLYYEHAPTIFNVGGKTLRGRVHHDENLAGVAYLDNEVSISLVAATTKLILKVIGEQGMDGLYQSEGYDSSLIPGHSDLFAAGEIPNCVTKK